MKIVYCVVFVVLLLAISVGYYYRWLSYSELSPRVREKERWLAAALRKRGLKPSYMLISGYRPPWLNRLLPLAVKNSNHMRGLAIDVFAFDVNNDGRWTRADTDLLANLLDSLDRKYPHDRGGVGLYYNSLLGSRMVHFDVSGRHRHWNKQ